MSSVPPELSDYIIDFLYDDPRALAACSLVCRDFLPTARFHYFSSIPLYGIRRYVSFAKLLEGSPALGRYVREVNIRSLTPIRPGEVPLVEKPLPNIVALLPQMKTLDMSSLDVSNAVKTVLTQATPVTELRVQYCVFPSFDDFVELFYSYPRIEELTLRGVSWRSLFHHSRDHITPAPQLRKLALGRDVDAKTIIDFMIDGNHIPHLETLSACCICDEDAAAVGPLLDTLGSSLKHLELEWNPLHSATNALFLPSGLSIQACDNLETLFLRCVITVGHSIPWASSLLADLRATAIKKISIEIRLLGDLDAVNWTSLQRTLIDAKFGCLQSVTFNLKIWSGVGLTAPEVEGMIRERIPLLERKGIVHVTS